MLLSPMFKNHKKIKFSSQLSFILLGVTVCLWSTAWEFLGLIESSYLFYLSVIFISLWVFIFYFDFKEIQKPLVYFLICFLSIHTIYFFVGFVEYIFKGYGISHILEYFIKQNISIIFCLLFSQYLFNEGNIDKFIKTVIYSYIIIFSILIYVYVYVFKSDFIGTAIDLDFGRSRKNKNTFGIFMILIFPFILTYIIKSRNFFVGSIFLILYFIMVYRIDSSTVIIISFFQLALYSLIIFKKFYLRLFIVIFSIFIIYPNFIDDEFRKSSDNISGFDQSTFSKLESDFKKEDMNKKPFIFLDSHRGRLLHSAFQKSKDDYFIGSGIQSFRIRDDNLGSLTETHNAYLSIFIDYGILGLFLFLFFYLYLLIKIFKKKNLNLKNYNISCVVYILSLLLTQNFINIEYTLSIWLLNGICIARAFNNQ